jgi:deoxycytidylate deaminase
MMNDMATTSFPRPEINNPELFFGIVSPVGADIMATVTALKKSLEEKGYETHHIKISDRFKDLAEFVGFKSLKPETRFDRVSTYIKFGDYLREEFGNEFLAAFAISEIAERRLKNGEGKKFERRAYIVDQLKTEGELSLLREVYGSSFFQISIYSARDVRVDHLARIMARDDKKRDKNSYREKAEKLVVTDEDETAVPHGQKVGKIFQLADVVINGDRSDEKNAVDQQVKRFIELLFGHNARSPNRLEYGMYLAHSAALRSLDLSRQVGAAIFRSSGEVATLGANEVPKARGGTYWCDDPHDAREFTLDADSNDVRKSELLTEVLDIVAGKNRNLTAEQEKALNASQFMDALEYGRIIHAEMSAITDAARLGISLSDATLFCTTFPCHMCSKHIVSSGIATVVFLEPYPKSLTADMHSDSVKIEGTSRGRYDSFPAVQFVPFYGITPRRYRELFYRTKRKVESVFSEYRNGAARPIVSIMAPWYAERETELIQVVRSKMAARVADRDSEGGEARQPDPTIKPEA